MRYRIKAPRSSPPPTQHPTPNTQHPRQKRKRRLPRVVWSEDWPRLLAAAANTRDAALLALGLYSGLRVAELMALDLPDLDPEGGTVHVRHGKGDKEAYAPYPRRAVALVDAWLAERPEPKPAARSALFTTTWGTRMTTRRAFDVVREAGERAGLGDDLHPHALRHSCASALIERGVGLETVKEYLRHEDIKSTQIYTHLRRDRLKAVAETLL